MDLLFGLASRNRDAKKSTKKIAISEPYRVSIVVSVVAVVNVFVMYSGLGVETVVCVVVLVSVRSE